MSRIAAPRVAFAAVGALALLLGAVSARATHDDVQMTTADQDPEEIGADSPASERGGELDLDELVANLFAGTWLDPEEPYWDPRRGERIEVGLNLGGEGAFSALSPDKLPSIGGVVLNAVVRYYPVDRLAVVLGGRTYLGVDGVPATGTTASSVASLITGIRYDLVRENRFSLLWDLYSGPSLYVFADLPELDAAVASVALGGEMGTGLAMRYSIGPLTGEARGLVGGRAGASSTPFQRAGDAGPFSSVYAGFDLGLTWSFQ